MDRRTVIFIKIYIDKSLHQLICSYVLNAYEYDDSEFQGPPRNLPRDEVFNLFGKL